MQSQPLCAEHTVAFTYTRGVGGATQRFLRGLARGELYGNRRADGRVVVPPTEHDPETLAPAGDFVRVADTGVVCSWTWVREPEPEHPLDRPFAFAFIRLDGADTALLHVIDVGDEGEMRTGLRVRADWRARRTGSITDIRAFVPGGTPARPGDAVVEVADAVRSDVRLEYRYEPGLVLSGFLRALGERRVAGGRCDTCAKVYVPPRPRCPACGAGPMTSVPVSDTGTIVSYTVVHVPVDGGPEVPFAWAWIRLDGTDVPFAHLLGDVPVTGISVGQRVRAVWEAARELAPTWESIRHFAPVSS